MREIKFRAWDEAGKKMHSEIYFKDFAHNSETIVHEQGLNDAVAIASKVYKLMQFTGLKDKNGKEIYEGDVVKRVYYFTAAKKPIETIDEIVYREDWGAFAFHTKHDIGEGWSHLYSGHKVYPWEVIGNIYENPELIK